MEYIEFPKIARLSRDMVITEKIDGTNACVIIMPDADDLSTGRLAIARANGLVMLAGSRSGYITPERDNFGFARWVETHASELWALGEGRHFGEWWGSGIQRGYGLPKGEKRFSLFNVSRWNAATPPPACCHIVPVLVDREPFNTEIIDSELGMLAIRGSVAAPGFMRPEGVIVYHLAGSGTYFKKTIEKDAEPKGDARG